MRITTCLAAASLVLAGRSRAQPPGAPALSTGAAPVQPAIIIDRIDLVPTGTMFAMNEPVLEGDTYVFKSLPERQQTRLPKSRVKAVARWSTDPEKEVLWKIDVLPEGSLFSGDEPVKKGSNWVAHGWKQGQLYSIPQADVAKITKLTGRDAYRAKMKELGVVLLEGESTTPGFKGGNAPVNAPQGAGAPAGSGTAQGPGNWTYQGQPGASDAYAPAGGTVSRPGDVPMAPTPH